MTTDLDLMLTREVAHPPQALWRAWTDPAQLTQWFCPKPWALTSAEVDLRPGGRFNTMMEGPNGERMESLGCYTEVVENRRLGFTDALSEGWRPAASPFMTAIIEFEPIATGTRYTATALHADTEAKKRHEDMGFYDGWGTALDQMIAMLEEMT